MKLIQFKNVTLIIILLTSMFSFVPSSTADSTSTPTVIVQATGSITSPPSSYVLLSYSSTPISVDASVDGDVVSSGDSIQIGFGSSVTVLATQIQDYNFSNWLIAGLEFTSNPIYIQNVVTDVNIAAVYTTTSSPTPTPTPTPLPTPTPTPTPLPTPTPTPTPPPQTNMIVGVNMYSGTPSNQFYDRDLPLLQQIGINYIRIGTGVTDTNVNRAIDNGIDIIGTFGTNGLPDLNAFGDYVYNRVLTFKGRVNAWVVFNEANYDGFRDNPQGYTEALQVAYVRAKEADPNIKIVTTNFLSTEGGLSFLEDMYTAGAQGYFDVLGIDPYCYPAPPTQPNQDQWGHTFWQVPELYNLMVQNGDGHKKVWIVEFGYRTPSNQYPLSHSTTVSEADQATYLIQAMELASTWSWLERFYIYEWMDSGNVDLGYWGLIEERYTAPYEVKPAYYAVKEFLDS